MARRSHKRRAPRVAALGSRNFGSNAGNHLLAFGGMMTRLTAALGMAAAIVSTVSCTVGDPISAGPDAGEERHYTNTGWSCSGTAGTSPNPQGVYYVTSFGCWIDSNGNPRGDGDDNCVPWCQSNAYRFGTQNEYAEMCGGMSGAACERSVGWYSADADRYGCMTRLRVTNPDNGRAAVVVVLDRGPSCSIERRVDFWALDLSYPASYYLFGEPKSVTERGDVIVEEVPMDTPLGPTDPDEGGGEEEEIDAGSGGGGDIDASPSGGDIDAGNDPLPTGDATLVGVIYTTPDDLNRIPYAHIELSTGHEVTASASGYYEIHDLPTGDVDITASAPGYLTRTITRELVDYETNWGSVRLYE